MQKYSNDLCLVFNAYFSHYSCLKCEGQCCTELGQEILGMGDKTAPVRYLLSPLLFSSEWFVLVSMRERFWWPTYTFGMWYEMKASCPPDQAEGSTNPEASIVVPDIWIMSHGIVPARREDIDSMTIRNGFSWICLQLRENAASTGILNSFWKCSRDICKTDGWSWASIVGTVTLGT